MAEHPSRTYDALELARHGRVIEGTLLVSEMTRLASSVAQPTGTLSYRIVGRLDDRGRAGALLRLTGDLALACQRCGAPLSFHLEREAAFRFVASEEELNAVPLDDDDEAEAIVGGHSMDLAAWLEEEAILLLPLVPRHDDCQPIAIEAREESVAPTRPNPFAALAQLKRDRKPD